MRLFRLALVVALLVTSVFLQFGMAPTSAASTFVYADALSGWEDLSWSATLGYSSTAYVRSGRYSISYRNTAAWGAWSITPTSGSFDTTPYTNIRFYVNGGTASNQKFGLSLGKNGVWGPKVSINSYMAGGSVAANQWRLVDVPLSALGAQNTTITRLMLQDISGVAQPTVYIDDVEFYGGNTATPTATPVSSTPVPTQPAATQTAAPTQTPVPGSLVVSVDASADVHAISPLIYGVSDSSGAQTWYKDMGASFVRWGGNARTRHNWEINASNAGSDWEFRNVSQASGAAGSASYNFVTKNKSIGAESLLTIPTIGWVAKDGNNSTMSTNVPSEGGPPVSPGSEAIAGYDPTANRNATSVRSYPKKNAAFSYPPSTTDGAVYQDEWISYLKNTFGTAQNGGVRFYAMDNEMDLWADSTHVDVHPVRAGYDETLARHKQYAEAVLGVDPTAQITGPVGWGWLSLWYSALDRGNDAFATAADRAAHGGTPFLQWFLQQVKAYDQSVGRRTLHVLDEHYYPQSGVYSSAVDTATQALRLRSTRSLWDPTYVDESWIDDTVMLIPRLRNLIATYYAGTKIGITEWNWGADNHINGALAIGDVLGIFGREDVYFANYWMSPANGSPGYWAWRMYRNYDGAYSRFGDVSVRAQTQAADVNKISAYASKDSATGELKVMLINKMPGTQANVMLNVSNFPMGGTAKVYRYSAANTSQITRLADLSGLSGSVSYALPAYSMSLFVFSPSSGQPTPTPTATNTAVPTPTSTPQPTATNTPMPTSTPLPTATSNPLPTSTPLPTATNTPLPTSTPVPTATSTPVSTSTPAPTATSTPTPTPTATTTAGLQSTVYADALAGWEDLSWSATLGYSSTAYVRSGRYSISYRNRAAWGAWSITPTSGNFDTTPYTNIRFYVNGGTASNQKFGLSLGKNGVWGPKVSINSYMAGGSVAANQWRLVDVPLSALGAQNKTITRLMLQDISGKAQPTVYIDDVQFYRR